LANKRGQALAKSGLTGVPNEQLLQDAYYGTGGFEDGTYLIPHRRERSGKYDKRREVAYYLNYMQAVVNSHVDPVFNQAISRNWGKGNTLFDKFSENIDCDGCSINDFMKLAGVSAKLKGAVAIVVDNFPEEDMPLSKADALNERKLPYAFTLEKEDIIAYKTDRFGRLVSFTYKEAVETNSNAEGQSQKWNTITWTPTEVKVISPDGKDTTMPNKCGRVPVTMLASRKVKRGEIKPPSEFLSIARTNLRIFNLCSELDEILRNQAFAILIYPGQRNKVPNQNAGKLNSAGSQDATAGSDEVSLGTDNMLGFPPDASNPPAFIAPPADPADMLMKQIDRLIQEIYRMAVLSFVTGVQEQKSGVAKQWDFQKTNQVLADFAGNCEKVERDIVDIFERWTGETVDYEVKYPDDFGIADILQALEEAAQALALGVGGEFNRQVKRKIASIYFADLADDEYEKVMKDIDQQHVDEQQAQDEQDALALEMKKKELENMGGNPQDTGGAAAT
jgi:hypothetical protein